MALPLQTAPIYTLTVPSTNKELKYRPFLVKEQKALLVAQQSEDMLVMIDTLKEVIRACAKTELDVEKLAVFDIEFIFSQIRAKSVGETVELFFFCDTCEDEKAKAKVTIDLTQMEVRKTPEHTNKIPLFDDVGVVMSYPTIDIIKKVDKIDFNEIEAIFDIIINSIDYIYTKDEILYANEQSKEDLEAFINNLNQEQFLKIQNFFETMPKLQKDIDFTCPVCGKAHHKVMEGLNNFF